MTWEAQRVSFGANAAAYDSLRPEWPAETARWLTGSPEGALRVVDLGAGTGKLTRALVELGHQVTAVDPSAGMLEQLAGSLPQVTLIEAPAERIPLPDGEADVVTVAQAWHWFRQPEAALEIARVLRPGGLLALAWHERDKGVPWVWELNELAGLQNQKSDGGRVHAGDTQVELPPPYGSLEKTTFAYELRLTPDQLAALASSWSYVDTAPDREQVLARIRQLGKRVAAELGDLALPHQTHCYRARLLT